MLNDTPYDESQYDFYEIAPVDELPNGERLFVELGDTPIAIFNIADNFYAIRDQCSHENLEIGDGDVDGYALICPHHGARFDLRTGEALTLPAVESVPVYPVRVRDGMIELGISREA